MHHPLVEVAYEYTTYEAFTTAIQVGRLTGIGGKVNLSRRTHFHRPVRASAERVVRTLEYRGVVREGCEGLCVQEILEQVLYEVDAQLTLKGGEDAGGFV